MSVSQATKRAAPVEEIAAHTALRGVAALCVVLYHVGLVVSVPGPAGLQGFVAHSYLFVDLFFGLSGYILGRKYADTFGPGVLGSDLRRFLVLRFARLYPNYLFWLSMAVAVSAGLSFQRSRHFGWEDGSTWSLLQHLTATQGLFGATRQWNVPLWSIGVEFMLYAILPLLLRGLFLAGRWGEVVVSLCALACLLALAASGSLNVITGAESVLRGFASFAIGVVIARPALRPTQRWVRLLTLLQLPALAGAVVLIARGQEPGAVVFLHLLICTSQVNGGILYRLACRLPFRVLGALSYSVYLSHAILLQLALVVWYKVTAGAAGMDFLGLAGLTLAGSLVAARLAHDRLERPAQAWLGRKLLS